MRSKPLAGIFMLGLATCAAAQVPGGAPGGQTFAPPTATAPVRVPDMKKLTDPVGANDLLILTHQTQVSPVPEYVTRAMTIQQLGAMMLGIGTAGQVGIYASAGSVLSGQGPFTAALPVLGNGVLGLQSGGRTGNTTTYAATAGAFINGNCRSTDANFNEVDAGGPCTVSGGGGTVTAGARGQIAAYNAAGSTVVGIPAQCTPIETFGGAGNNSTVNDTPFDNLVAAFGANGGCIGFAPGIYAFSSARTITYPTTVPYVVSIKGSGQDLSILNWSAAPTGAGVKLATNKGGHAFHVTDLSFRVGVAAASSVGLSVQNTAALGQILTSTIEGVSFLGSDGGQGTDYWGIGIKVLTQSDINFTDDTFWGSGTNQGIGISVASTASPGYGVIYNITNSYFYVLNEGILYGDYIQGMTVQGCNFTVGNNGIVSIPNPAGVLAELSVVNSQFGLTATNSAGINLLGPVETSNINNNYFLIPPTNGIGVSGAKWGGGGITNNFFGVQTTARGGQTAIFIENSIAGSPTTITGNQFLDQTTAVDLLNTSNDVTVGINAYDGNSNKVVNGGATACPASASGNCVGTATSGAGFVP